MINNISIWAEHVIIAVIIGTILEMILPNGNSKKYIKTVIGIYILYTIISPVITLATGYEIKLDYASYEEYFNNSEEYKNLENEINNVTYNTIENTYKEELKKQIKNNISSLGFSVSSITFDIDLETGTICNLDIVVNKKEELSNTNSIIIELVEIGNKKNKENDLSRQEIIKIKENIQENFGIKSEDILINSI